MKLLKRQKFCIATFMIALSALFIDRAFLGGGSSPIGASASLGEAPSEHISGPVDSPNEDSQPPTIRLGQRIETLWLEKDLEIEQAKDVFTLPESWLADILPTKTEDIPPPKDDAITVFITSHQLQAVVISDQICCVTVNDQVLCLGDELKGFTLIAIEEDSATFEFGTRRAILRLVSDR